VKNFPENKKEEKKVPNKKDKEDVYKKEAVEAKKSIMKKVRGKANSAIKDVTGNPIKANVNEKEAHIIIGSKKNNTIKNEESNNNQANSAINEQKPSSNITIAYANINTKNINKEDKKKISSFIAEQKKKTMEQIKVDSSKSNDNEATKFAANVGNKKVKKNVPEKNTNKTNDKSVKESEKKKDKKDDKSISPGKKNALNNKKGKQEKIGADLVNNNKQTFLKRKRETYGQNKPNKESVKINSNAKKR
jgi:hypothetical protein